jgi:putative flippase GtrA
MDVPVFLRKLFRFAAVGGLNTLVTLSVFYLVHNIFHANYLIASVAGYTLGIINSYIWNKVWTFESSSKSIGFEFSKFIALNLTGFLLNVILMWIFVEVLKIIPLVAQVLTIGIIFFLNFFGSLFWVFKDSSFSLKP